MMYYLDNKLYVISEVITVNKEVGLMHIKTSVKEVMMLDPNHYDIQSAKELYYPDNWLAENTTQFLDNHNGE
jgi:hypothetical protein